MNDDLIDEDGFSELGIPSPLQMWKQQTRLLIGEVDDLQRELRQSRANLSKVITMHDSACKQRDALALELTRMKWELSDRLLAESQAATKKLNAYAGAHNHGKYDG
jgi:uncharacterized protein (DUF3084 family)